MRTFVIFSLFSLALAAVRFDGDQVLTLFPTSNEHIKLLREIDSYDTLADFWKPDNVDGVRIGKPVDIRFKRENLFAIKQKFQQANLGYNVKIFDLQQVIDNQLNARRPGVDSFEHDHYHPYDEVMEWTHAYADDYPNIVKREILEMSEEGREIPMLTITEDPTITSIVLIDCGNHAREWITPAFCHYFAERLVTSNEPAVQNLRANLKFVIVPLLNPDGYAYSWTNDRMWRKTRSVNSGSVCVGVDPNRNFDANFGGPGSSSSPCSDVYHGPAMESEKLTQGLTRLIKENEIDAYLTFHSYGQIMLYPYSKDYTSVAENAAELDYVAAQATAALQQVHGKTYIYGAGRELLYVAAGGSDDMAQDYGAKLSYTLELRDEGQYGFLLPEDQIIPTCEENFELVRSVCEYVISKQ